MNRYPASISTYPKDEIKDTQIKTRNPPNVHGGFHPKSSVLKPCTQKEHGKLETYHRLKDELGRLQGPKASVIPLVIGALRTVTPPNSESGSNKS